MRLVVDTNVVVSALLWRGAPHRLFRAAQDHAVEFFTSRILLDELEEVLAGRKLEKAVGATGSTHAALFRDYRELAHVVIPADTRRIIAADRDDDAVIGCALAARAELIVSGDRRVLDIKSYQDILIVSAAEALARLIQLEER